jgi:hypothetical protein
VAYFESGKTAYHLVLPGQPLEVRIQIVPFSHVIPEALFVIRSLSLYVFRSILGKDVVSFGGERKREIESVG